MMGAVCIPADFVGFFSSRTAPCDALEKKLEKADYMSEDNSFFKNPLRRSGYCNDVVQPLTLVIYIKLLC